MAGPPKVDQDLGVLNSPFLKPYLEAEEKRKSNLNQI